MYSEAPESTRVVGFGRGTEEFPMCGYTLTPGENRSQPVLFALVCSCMFLWYPSIVFNILLPAWFDFKHHMELQWLILLLSDSTTRPFSFKYHSFARFASSPAPCFEAQQRGTQFLGRRGTLCGKKPWSPGRCARVWPPQKVGREACLSQREAQKILKWFSLSLGESDEWIWMVDNRQIQKIIWKKHFFVGGSFWLCIHGKDHEIFADLRWIAHKIHNEYKWIVK